MKSSLRIFFLTSLVLLLAIAIVVGCWRPGLMRAQPNNGHQLGGDLLVDVPGNTIEAFEIGIREHEVSSEWKYAECDVHFLAFVRNVKRSFDEPRQWLDRFSDAGFRVYQVYRPKTQEYDLCETWGG